MIFLYLRKYHLVLIMNNSNIYFDLYKYQGIYSKHFSGVDILSAGNENA